MPANPRQLFVGSLSESTNTASLKQCFQQFGELVDCKVVLDPQTKKSKQFGFVTFRNQTDAAQAVASMNKQDLDDFTIVVEFARDPATMVTSRFRAHTTTIPIAQSEPVTYSELPFDNANKMPFITLCERLDLVQRVKGSKQKLDMLFDDQFVKYLHRQSWYPVMRLILPDLDGERPKYNLREKAMGKLLVNAMGLPPTNDYADRLLHWRDPGKTNGGDALGDFPNVLREVLQARKFPTILPAKLSVGDVNEMLDELHNSISREQRQSVIFDLLNKSTLTEVYWFTRIVIKDMSCGLSYHSVLKRYHPDAIEAVESHGNLRRCLAELNDPSKRRQFQIELNTAISPMLARIVPMNVATEKLGDFVIEPKLDGDRILVHIDKTCIPAKVKLFTRNLLDYTQVYGSPAMFDSLLEAVNCSKCILDGEMLAWDEDQETVLNFGQTRSVANAMNQPNYTGRQWLYYMVFDALMIEDSKGGEPVLTTQPLRTRRARLQSLLKPIERRVELVPQLQIVTDTDLELRHQRVMVELDRIILNKGEGLILKSLSSPYVGGETGRKIGYWVKVKPEHVHGLQEEVDCVILGGYFSEGKRRSSALGDPSMFLMGIPDPRHEGKFLTLTKVGTGYSMHELDAIRIKLRPFLVRSSDRPAPHFETFAKRADVPDVWVPPEHSLVLQVTGSELVPNDTYSAKCTIRFPRVSRVRYDKSFRDCTSLEDVQRFATDFKFGGGGLHGAKRAADVMRLEAHKRVGLVKRRRREQAQVLGVASTEHLANVQATGTVFEDLHFYVFPDTTGEELGLINKQAIEEYIAKHGGTVVQIPSGKHETVYIASAQVVKRPSQRLRNMFFSSNSTGLDLMKVDFLVECVADAEHLHDPRFEDYLVMSDVTRKRLGFVLDEFGDHYEQDADIFSLERCMKAVPTNYDMTDSQVLQALLEDGDDPLASSFNTFRGVFAYCPLDQAKECEVDMLMLRLLGGKALTELTEQVTHVFFMNEASKEQVERAKLEWRNAKHNVAKREPFWLKVSFVQECIRADLALPWEHFSTQRFEV